MRKLIVLFACLLAAGVVPGCAGQNLPPQPTPGEKPAATVARPEKAGWQERWDRTLAAARSEGVVMVYTSSGPSIRTETARDFQNRYGIRLEFVAGTSGDITAKIVAERRAGLFLADVFQTGSGSMTSTLNPSGFIEPLEPLLILPEVNDPKAWLRGEVPFHNKDRTVISFLGSHFSHVVVNTDMVKDGQLTSYYDVLKPEWKGQIVMDMPTVPGPGRNWLKIAGGMVNFDEEKLRTYLRQLSAQGPLITRDRRLEVEWVSKGKYAVLLGVHTEMYADFKAIGSPILMLRMKEGSLSTAGPGAISLLKQAPHPNATIVFLNWLLSKEGQESYIRTLGSPSLRLDVPTTGIDPAFVGKPGETAFVDNEEMENMANRLVEIAQQALAAQLK